MGVLRMSAHNANMSSRHKGTSTMMPSHESADQLTQRSFGSVKRLYRHCKLTADVTEAWLQLTSTIMYVWYRYLDASWPVDTARQPLRRVFWEDWED